MVTMENICAMKVFDEAGEFIRGWDDLADYKDYPDKEFEFGDGCIRFKLVKSEGETNEVKMKKAVVPIKCMEHP